MTEGRHMDRTEVEELEEFVAKEEARNRATITKWFIGVAAVCLAGWISYVSLGATNAYSMIESINRLEGTLEKVLGEHDRDTEAFRQQISVLDARMDKLPPDEWRARIVKLEEAAMDNRDSHAEIKVTLAEIKADLKTAIGKQGEPK